MDATLLVVGGNYTSISLVKGIGVKIECFRWTDNNVVVLDFFLCILAMLHLA